MKPKKPYKDLKEAAFEEHIEKELVRLHKYRKRNTESDYNRELAIDSGMLFEFIEKSQKNKFDQLKARFGDSVSEQILGRLDDQIKSRGIIDVLRKGIEYGPEKLDLIYFKPVTSLNPETERLYNCNIFSVIRQVKFSKTSGQSVDLVLFVNGIPIATAELKNELTGQNVHHAMRQYRMDRSPEEKLFSFKRCIAHFAIDTSEVYLTTHLKEDRTYFLPFNKGFENGAGNPPAGDKHKTHYLWEEVWSPGSWSDLLHFFAHFYIEMREDRLGKEYKVPIQVFPRYHQRKTVLDLLNVIPQQVEGKNYLIHHSAGSGKSMTIAWLAYRLSELHTKDNKKIYDSIIIITDRRALNKQLRDTVSSFISLPGVLIPVTERDPSSKLKDALETGAKIITTTIQRFQFIVDTIGKIPSKKFALIVDEAHSSQSGEMVRTIHGILQKSEDIEDWLLEQVKSRKQPSNVSYFAFTATPKHETLERFGERQPDGSFRPFSLYSMKQAIEEEFILDVLTNYTTYRTYFKLIKKAGEDPTVPRNRALTAILRYVNLHEVTLNQKIEVIMGHFENTIRDLLRSESKAMIVTSSREAVARYKLALDLYLRANNYHYRTLAAFTDSIEIDGASYTEASINGGIPEDHTAREFKKPEYRFLIVAEKFQTGFDEPYLSAMYVDKRLSGVQAVQTLSRLNRTSRDKNQIYVLDFVNETDDIQKAFEPYYTSTILSESTDVNALNDLRLALFGIYTIDDKTINEFIQLIDPEADQIHEQANALLDKIANQVVELEDEAYKQFLSIAGSYVKRYPYIAQVFGYADVSHEKLFLLLKYLLKKLPRDRRKPLAEILKYLDMDSVRVVRKLKTQIKLGAEEGDVKAPIGIPGETAEEPTDLLSKIIQDVNKRWGVDFGEEQQKTLGSMSEDLASNDELQDVVSNNTKQNAEIHFGGIFENKVDDQFDTDRKLWEQLTNNKDLRNYVQKSMFKYVFEKVLSLREEER